MKYNYILIGILILTILSCEKADDHLYGNIIEVPNEVTTIKGAISIAKANDTILICPGEYFESGIIINKGITIISEFSLSSDSAMINETIINGEGNTRVFMIDSPSETVKLDGFTIKNGNIRYYHNTSGNPETFPYTGGGIYCVNTDLELTNLVISNNRAGEPISRGSGGGININNSTVFMDNITLLNNFSFGSGGALDCWNSTLVIQNSKISGNDGAMGKPAVFISESQIDFSFVLFANNGDDFNDFETIIFQNCNGNLDNVTAIGDPVRIYKGSIDLTNCNIPDINYIY